MAYTSPPIHIFKTETFDAWFSTLRDRMAKVRIAARIDRLTFGNPGDVRPAGSGISEMRVDHGPGYRIYFRQHGPVTVVLLCGGDKRSQVGDIRRALELSADWKG